MALTQVPSSMLANSGAELGMRNRIINGAMQIAQRGTSGNCYGNVYVSLDRYSCYGASGQGTFSQNTSAPAGFSYSSRIQRTSGNTNTSNMQITQIIESQNMIDLAGQQVTFSFYAKAGANLSSSSSQMYYGVQTGTVADQGGGSTGSWTGVSNVLGTTYITLTTSWQRFSFTGTVPSNALEITIYLGFFPTGTAGADDAVYITGVQLEVGSNATPFERRLYGQELALCQRYYYRNTAPSTGTLLTTFGVSQGATSAIAMTQFPVPMRAAPTALEQSGTASHYQVFASSNVACNAVPTFLAATAWYATTTATAASGLGSNLPCWITAANTAAYLGWSAEL